MQTKGFVINIGREVGSGGKAVGEIVARRLGAALYDKELIALAAERSGLCPECFERTDERPSRSLFAALVGYLRAPFAGDDGAAAASPLSGEALFQVQSDVIRGLAARESCVFVGRCADYILRDHPRVLNVFISGARADRIRRVAERRGIAEREAEALIEREDARRAAYYNYYSCGRWGQAATYHLCIDSSALGLEATADCIVAFAARKLGIEL
ncbi:MAG: cytidylate kinase-like family protein [Alistipes sp.]|nr:cytidylate kinase-like family protein [Alistipes sp.]